MVTPAIVPLAAAEVATIGAMDYGICLPKFPAGASNEGIEAAADAAERHGWSTVWTTGHVLVDHSAVADYGRIYEAILTLAWVGARHPGLRLGTSVIVVPQRNAVLLAKELATLDALSEDRVIAGIGGGWSEPEFANLGMADRFRVRGAYLDGRSACGGTCGRARPSRSRADSIRSRTSSSNPCRRKARACRSSSAGEPRRRCAVRGPSATDITRARPARPNMRNASRSSGRRPKRPGGRRRDSRPGSVSSSARRPTTHTPSAGRPTRWRPRSGPSRRSG